jgi:DNA (cytosine-5)-methyltransferase 1
LGERSKPAPSGTTRFRALSLFSGCGGLDLGAIRAGFKVVQAIDLDADAVRTYNQNLDPCAIVANVTQLAPSFLPGNIDLLLGGPPCQGFSSAGTKRQDDPRNFLWQWYLKVLAQKQPAVFILENVTGFLEQKREFMAGLRSDCRDAYAVEFRKVNTQFYGVPQYRYRVIVVGIRRDLRTWPIWPQPDFPEASGYRKSFPCLISMQQALQELGPPRSLEGKTRVIEFQNDHVYVPFEASHIRVTKHIPNGGSLKDIPSKYLPPTYAGRPKEGRFGWHWYYRKPLPILPARTVLASIGPTLATVQAPDVEYHRDGNRWLWKPISPGEHTSTDGLYTSPIPSRRLTLRECARLQTFPDWFVFEGHALSCHRMIGNAVPCEYARRLCASLRQLLSGEITNTGSEQMELSLAE